MARNTEPVTIDITPAGTPKSPFSLKETTAMSLAWQNLVFEVEVGDSLFGKKDTKKIVKGTSGYFKPGTLTALMGPSGAGKSTMMNVLAGRAPYGKITEGDVILNGKKADPSVYRQQLAYVMQHDSMFATQTPREALNFTARLRLPEYTAQQREEIVDQALTALRLQKCADTKIGSVLSPGLSGGEKKRAAVAIELITSPSLIFLDEPTSGLDSQSAFELIQILKQLAETGCTIVCTIHQPSSEVFALFDNVVFLRFGRMMYQGPVSGIPSHFSFGKYVCGKNVNPADFAMQILQIASEEEIDMLASKVELPKIPEITGNLTESDVKPTEVANIFAQLGELSKREFRNLIRDQDTAIARFGMSIMLSLMCGIVFFEVGDKWGEDGNAGDIESAISNHWGALIFFCMNAMFLSAQPMVLAFPLERAAYMREAAAGTYYTVSYLLAKTFIDVPAAIFQQLLQLVIMYFLSSLNANFAFWLLGSSLVAGVSSSMALLIGAGTSSAQTAVSVLPAIYVPQILFSGFFISSDEIPSSLRWLQWAWPLKYTVNVVTAAEFASDHVPANRTAEVADFLDRSEIEIDDWWIYVTILLGMFVLFRILACIVLYRRSKNFE